jgi:hypothetical protein
MPRPAAEIRVGRRVRGGRNYQRQLGRGREPTVSGQTASNRSESNLRVSDVCLGCKERLAGFGLLPGSVLGAAAFWLDIRKAL